jgi:hypothetical protein
VAEVFAKGIEATVRHTVDAVSSLKKNEVSLGELAAKLRLEKKSHQSPSAGCKPAAATSSTWKPDEAYRRRSFSLKLLSEPGELSA